MKLFNIITAFSIFLGTAAWAAGGVPFTIASETLPPLPPNTEASSVLLRLKQQAVREYLQKVLGPRYERYDALITPKFAEDYVINYQVIRQSPDSSQMEIGGNIDGDGLKQWVRLNETKATGSTSLKPLFLLSSTLPAMPMDPRQTAAQVKQNTFAQTIFKQLNDGFGRFNATMGTSDDVGLGITRPPSRETELRALRSYGNSAGFNSAVWVNLSTCRGCGVRMDLHLYNLSQAREVQSISADVELEASELNDPKKLMRAVGKTLQSFATGFENSVSEGTLFASEYRVVVQGVESYKTYKAIDSALSKQDFVLQSSLAHSEANTAEFKILSPLPPRELYQRFLVAQFPGMTLKPVGIDSQTVTVRYLQ